MQQGGDGGGGGGEKGPLASPLQSGRIWHQHCSIITAKSCWWKTLGLLRRAISINIYARVAGNRMKPSFQCLWRETEEMKGNVMQITALTQTSHSLNLSQSEPLSACGGYSSGMWPENTRCIHWFHVNIHTDSGLWQIYIKQKKKREINLNKKKRWAVSVWRFKESKLMFFILFISSNRMKSDENRQVESFSQPVCEKILIPVGFLT